MRTFIQLLENTAEYNRFMEQIIGEYPDTTSMHILADWLEERGDKFAQAYHDLADHKSIFSVNSQLRYSDTAADDPSTKKMNLSEIVDLTKKVTTMDLAQGFWGIKMPEGMLWARISINSQLVTPYAFPSTQKSLISQRTLGQEIYYLIDNLRKEIVRDIVSR